MTSRHCITLLRTLLRGTSTPGRSLSSLNCQSAAGPAQVYWKASNEAWSSELWNRCLTTASNSDRASAAESSSNANEPSNGGDASNTQTQEIHQEDLGGAAEQKDVVIESLKSKVEELTDRVKRALAEGENTRTRMQRENEQIKQFAVQGFVKSVLEVADNLQRAAESVPESVVTAEGFEKLDKDRALSLLKNLLTGVQMTDKVLMQVFKQQGVISYNPINEKFDPNFHNALFEVPDAEKEPGTVAVVTKRGYKLHDRVIRPAEVGVVRSPQ